MIHHVCQLFFLGFVRNKVKIDRYDHTDTNTDYPVWIPIKPIPIPIIRIGYTNYRYQLYQFSRLSVEPYQPGTAMNKTFTDFLEELDYLEHNIFFFQQHFFLSTIYLFFPFGVGLIIC